jgi:hypothetical protein
MLVGAYMQFPAIAHTGLLGPLAKGAYKFSTLVIEEVVGNGQWPSGNVCTSYTETADDLAYRGACSQHFSDGIDSAWRPLEKDLASLGLKRWENDNRAYWWPDKRKQVDRFLDELMRTIGLAAVARWTALRPRYIAQLAAQGIHTWKLTKSEKLAAKAKPKKQPKAAARLPFKCRKSDCSSGATKSNDLCNTCATSVRYIKVTAAINKVLDASTNQLAAKWTSRPNYINGAPPEHPAIISLQNQLQPFLPLTDDRRQLQVALI